MKKYMTKYKIPSTVNLSYIVNENKNGKSIAIELSDSTLLHFGDGKKCGMSED